MARAGETIWHLCLTMFAEPVLGEQRAQGCQPSPSHAWTEREQMPNLRKGARKPTHLPGNPDGGT